MERYKPSIETGLTSEQVEERKNSNLINNKTDTLTKSIKSIIVTNFFTIFNLINLLLALAVFFVKEYRNMLFIMLVAINTAISTIQEIHSKRIIDKLSLISSAKAECIRNGKKEKISINEIVLDDILIFQSGNQVVVDSIIKKGEVEVNESFITGEAEPVLKKEGDSILSGSFIISGKCVVQVEHVGEENFTAKIAKETKYIKQVKSEIMTSLNQIIKVVSILIIPIGAILFFHQLSLEGGILKDAVVHTVAAIIGMIPEGLVLLTSTVLAVSVIRLSRSKVLVQELFCIETLARVDMLCLDKTGTITEGKMQVNDIVPINTSKENMEEILSEIVANTDDTNATMEAIKDKFNLEKGKWKVKQKIAFSSQTKWSGLAFEGKGSYIIGAPEVILKNNQDDIQKYLEDYRVLLLAKSNEEDLSKELPQDIEIVGYILITDIIRKNAKETLQYFKEQGVKVRIISGDNPVTVSKIAKQAGIEGYENFVDMMTITNEEQIKEAVKKYTIFGRVTPIQKKQIVTALKELGHTVAMTGDGVNDIIALKEADCSIAMAEGSDAAKNVSQIVLLDSDFSAMPKIVAEGRRTINNIERSATLFLTKTIYSTILAIMFVFISMSFPFMPIQLSLIGLVCTGIPSFILALEPNKSLVKGNFMGNVISKSIPAALTVILNIIIVLCINSKVAFPPEVYSSICVILTVLTGFMVIVKISRPFNLLRSTLLLSLIAIFTACCFIFDDLFSIILPKEYIKIVVILGIITICNFVVLQILSSKILKNIRRKKANNGI